MTFDLLKLARILANPRIAGTPLRVLRELRKRNIKRLPDEVFDDLQNGGNLKALKFLRNWLRAEMLTRHNGQWVLNSFLPPFPGTAFERMFENLLSGRRLSPVSAYLAVTSRCPFNCPHCSLDGRTPGELDASSWLDIIAQLHDLGVSIIGLTGGEPLLHEALPDLVKAASAGGAATIVFSSGWGMNEAYAARLKAAGLWAFCTSVDSCDKALSAERRNSPKALETAVEALKISVASGFYTMIGSVAHPDFVDKREFEAIYAEARNLGVHEYRLVEPMPCGKLLAEENPKLLNSEQVNVLREFHRQTNRLGKSPKVCAFNHVESPHYFGCGGGTQHLFIDHNGEVSPCDFTPLSFGNATAEPLADIWSRMNEAMVNPRRHCFVQKNHRLIRRHLGDSCHLPLPPETSLAICREVGSEPFPDYFAVVTGRKGG
jgi:MoaA/NifB/PqqE/SkfB family radical SAM enzyme